MMKWRYSFSILDLGILRMSVRIHTPASLPAEKWSPVKTGYEAGGWLAPELV
jgi:hypothetical protein